MNVNKKLDRFKQWAGERMGGEVKTNVTDNFKALEMEMQLRHEGETLASPSPHATRRTYPAPLRRAHACILQECNASKSP